MHAIVFVVAGAALLLSGLPAAAQNAVAEHTAELTSLRTAVKNIDARTRTDAIHRIWRVGVASSDLSVKKQALDMLREPIGSDFDQIRLPAAYAIAEIANSTPDGSVKTHALQQLGPVLKAGQVPVRDFAILVVDTIAGGGASQAVSGAAVTALSEPINSGNNAVRMPAIFSLVRIAGDCRYEDVCSQAINLLLRPMASQAAAGGIEVRMLAVAAMERIAVNSGSAATKGQAMGLLQSESGRRWEPEAVRRAQAAVAAIKASMK
jgi:hypothetical protein